MGVYGIWRWLTWLGLTRWPGLRPWGQRLWHRTAGRLRKAYRMALVRAKGDTLEAQVLSVWDSGMSLGEDLQLVCHLRLLFDDEPACVIRSQAIIPRHLFPQVQPGSRIPVVVYRRNPQWIAIDLGESSRFERLVDTLLRLYRRRKGRLVAGHY